MLYTADNAKLKINNEEILASNAAISLGANLSPNYLMTQRHTQSQVANNGIGGSLTFSYYLTGKDYFKTLKKKDENIKVLLKENSQNPYFLRIGWASKKKFRSTR